MPKIRFRSPKKADIVIIDVAGSKTLITYVLFDISYEIFHNRRELFYISPIILLRTFLIAIVEIVALFRTEKKHFQVIQFPSLFFLAYTLACIDQINPKVAITVIDNNPKFDLLSKKRPNIPFYAIQNGIRVINDSFTSDNYELMGFNVKLSAVQNYVCFGENEVQYYSKFGSQIKHYYPVGSLKGSIYKYYLHPEEKEIKWDICLISQYRKPIIEGNARPIIKFNHDLLNQFLRMYLLETGLTLCIALSSDMKSEEEYFWRYYKNSAIYIPNDREQFSTYMAMDHSALIITHSSTAALEAFGWGKKVLFCNYTQYPERDFSSPEIFHTNIKDYQAFKEALSNLFFMDNGEYDLKTKNKQKYFMNYDTECPVNLFLYNIIRDHCEKGV